MACNRCEQLGAESGCDPKSFCQCKFVIPTPEEDQKIFDAAKSDPDALPLTSEQLAQMKPFREITRPRSKPMPSRVFKDTILMCFPSEFDVSYSINPWMTDHIGNCEWGYAREQWIQLSYKIAQYANLNVMTQAAGLPDMVFTANAGLVIGPHFVPSKFKHQERQGEEQFFTEWFEENGFNIVNVPDGMAFEGAGDALFDRDRPILWMGYGHRTDLEVADFLWHELNLKVLPLNLVDDRFYHLDTCFCPLNGGYVMYYPAAFDQESLELIEREIPEMQRIIVSEEDALNFACNAVNIDNHIILNKASDALKDELNSILFTVHENKMTEFMKAGGSAKCLTIRLNETHMLLDALCF